MSSDFSGSYGDDPAELGYNPRLSSQRFDSARFGSNYAESEQMREEGFEEDLSPYGSGDVVSPQPPVAVSEGSEFAGNGPILPPAVEMEVEVEVEEGFALREWRRQNAIRLEEKERKEKEMLKEIIKEADDYKEEHNKKWKIRCENSRAVNREKEKLFIESRDKFHAEADKSYWKAVSEIIPKEVPVIEKKGKKEKKPSIVVIQGPKPGKPTDLSRMRQILVRLKHKPPGHIMSPPLEPGKDAKTQETTPPAVPAVPAVAK